MTSASNYTYVPASAPQTQGLATHRHTHLPSAALRTNAAGMPPAWQTRNAPYYEGQRHDVPVRSFGDIAKDPFRFLTATTPRKIASGVCVAAIVLLVLF